MIACPPFVTLKRGYNNQYHWTTVGQLPIGYIKFHKKLISVSTPTNYNFSPLNYQYGPILKN